jgi:hypothetical protein
LFVGPIAIGTIDEWEPSEGSVITWQPTAAAVAKAQQAPVSAVPASYMQSQHLRGFYDQEARGLDYSRLMVVACDVSGRCDVRAMTYIINAHLRRHDTYRSWFDCRDADNIVRHTMTDAADIEFAPTKHGQLTVAEIRKLISSTPEPRQWDCFRFGVIQGKDRFTFFASLDHLHVDAMMVGVTLMEFHMMYGALVGGSAPLALPEAGSYDEFCARERMRTSALTVDSPEVRTWIDFAEKNNGGFPDFPLPLGDPSLPVRAEMITVRLMDERQTARFESACIAAGARFIGGVFACTAMAESEFTGADSYFGLTPSDTRSTPTDFMTQGWFTGLVPITIPDTTSFGDAARAAQASFDSGIELAKVPYYRVLELAPWLNRPQPNFPVLNFLDAGAPPLSALLTGEMDELNIGLYSDGKYSYQLCIYVIRMATETAVSVLYPDNPIARESVSRYAAALRSACLRVAEGRSAVRLRDVAQA